MEKITNIYWSEIKYINYGKANCATEIMRYKEVERHLIEKLLKRPELADKLGIKINSFKWTHAEIPSDIDTMEQIYDIILGNQLAGKRGEKKRRDYRSNWIL